MGKYWLSPNFIAIKRWVGRKQIVVQKSTDALIVEWKIEKRPDGIKVWNNTEVHVYAPIQYVDL